MSSPTRLLQTIRELIDLRYFNARSTMRSSLGFMRTLLRPASNATSLEQIFNFLPISETLASAGQPSPAQFPMIAGAGYQLVINLAPHNAENAIANERELVESLGMEYVHIPVHFQAPKETDFERFVEVLSAAGTQPVFVHCAANMRVSAFLYRYRTEILAEPESQARSDLERIWKPFGTWADFIKR